MKKNNEVEEKSFKSTFIKLWNNKRTHAAMVLGLWMIFLLFVMIISFVGGKSAKNELINNDSSNQVEEEKNEFKDYEVMQQELLENNYEYEYIINTNENKIIYKGERIGVTETGYRENLNETIKYYVDETGLYKVVMDELHAMDKLYENVIESYIDIEYIFNMINNQSVTSEQLEDTRIYTYNYISENINYIIVITTDIDNITNIDIKFDDKHYELKYSNIKKIENLSFIPKEVN